MMPDSSNNDDIRIIRRFRPVSSYGEPPADAVIKRGVITDTETTGLEADSKIIELAAVAFQFCARTGTVFSVDATASWLEDPGEPLSDEVKAVTGLTDDMLAGQRIDDAAAIAVLGDADLIIAHNADFDRPRIERRLPGLEAKFWACTASQIDWRAEGVESAKLAYVAYRLGFFFEAHRAVNDCQALLHAMQQFLPVSGQLVMQALLENARRPTFRVWAVHSPFEMKDALKARGYRWSAGEAGRHKAWYRDVTDEAAADAELQFLAENRCRGQVVRISGRDLFSERAFRI